MEDLQKPPPKQSVEIDASRNNLEEKKKISQTNIKVITIPVTTCGFWSMGSFIPLTPREIGPTRCTKSMNGVWVGKVFLPL